MTIRPGYWVALAVAVAILGCTVVASTVLGAVDRLQRQHNDRAARELAAVVWPAQLHPWQDNGCGWTKVRICFKDNEPVEVAARRAAVAMRIRGAASTTYPGYDGAPVASVTGTFDGVPVAVTAYPRVEYPSSGVGSPTPVAEVVVALSPSTVLYPAEAG